MSQQSVLLDVIQLTIKSPLQYPGGKHFARQQLSEHIPFGTKVVVSPFFGGGSLELYLAGKRHITIKGYDAFYPLVNFWEQMSKDPVDIFNLVDSHVNEKCRDYLIAVKEGRYHELKDSAYQAAMFYLLQALSYNSTGFRGRTLKNYKIDDGGSPVNPTGKSWGIMFNHHELKDYYNPLVSVGNEMFQWSLGGPVNDPLFAYCDPPYPEVAGMYGDGDWYHEDFDHDALKEILDERTGDWLLSYNDCKTVRTLYPESEYNVIEVQWKQGSRKSGVGNELLIKPKRKS